MAARDREDEVPLCASGLLFSDEASELVRDPVDPGRLLYDAEDACPLPCRARLTARASCRTRARLTFASTRKSCRPFTWRFPCPWALFWFRRHNTRLLILLCMERDPYCAICHGDALETDRGAYLACGSCAMMMHEECAARHLAAKHAGRCDSIDAVSLVCVFDHPLNSPYRYHISQSARPWWYNMSRNYKPGMSLVAGVISRHLDWPLFGAFFSVFQPVMTQSIQGHETLDEWLCSIAQFISCFTLLVTHPLAVWCAPIVAVLWTLLRLRHDGRRWFLLPGVAVAYCLAVAAVPEPLLREILATAPALFLEVAMTIAYVYRNVRKCCCPRDYLPAREVMYRRE